MTQYTGLERLLIQYGFTEFFGIGLWAVSQNSIMADTNSGNLKLYPYVDASDDNFIGIYTESDIDVLNGKLAELKKNNFSY